MISDITFHGSGLQFYDHHVNLRYRYYDSAVKATLSPSHLRLIRFRYTYSAGKAFAIEAISYMRLRVSYKPSRKLSEATSTLVLLLFRDDPLLRALQYPDSRLHPYLEPPSSRNLGSYKLLKPSPQFKQTIS